MWKMGLKIGIGLIVIAIVGIFGINKYLDSTTIFQYGTIPSDTIPEKYEEVTYTIPTIDKDGNRSTQTFTVKHDSEGGQIVKLYIRNDKVKKHEFVTKEDIPKKVREDLPTSHF